MGADKSVLFQPTGTTLDKTLAYVFSVLSNIAYLPANDAPVEWGNWFGFDESKNVQTSGFVIPDFSICRSADSAVIAIPGTEAFTQFFQYLIHSSQVPSDDVANVKVHSFAYYAMNELMKYVEPALQGLPTGTKISLCGHSLGGAIAQLMAWRLDVMGFQVKNVFVFNSPKVGNFQFARKSKPWGFCHVANTYDKVKEFPFARMIQISIPSLANDFSFTDWEHIYPLHLITVSEDIKDAWIPAFSSFANATLYNELTSGAIRSIPATIESATPASIQLTRTVSGAFARLGMTYGAGIALLLLNSSNHKLARLIDAIYAEPD